MKTYVHIPAIGEPTTFQVDPKGDELKELQKRVGGTITSGGVYDRHTIYVDDEGLFKGYYVNAIASKMARQMLVGDAVLVGPVYGDGHTASVSPTVLAELGLLKGAK